MNAEDYKAALRRVPTGISIVTTLLGGVPKGFTANAFASVSLAPPMILVCVNRSARTHPLISRAELFCLNLLRLEQTETARRFATGHPDPFADLALHTEVTGAPVLDEALAFFDCKLAEEHAAGTHTIFIGEVLACSGGSGAPLGYFNGAYRDFGCRIP